MFVIIVIIAVAMLVGSIVKIRQVNAEYFSEAKMDEMARKAAEKATKHITKITCDYCGMVIDITSDKVCPNCGATYGNDEEYINRNAVDEELRDKEYKLAYEKARDDARAANRASYRVVKRFIIFSAIAVAVFIVPMIISLVQASTAKIAADIIEKKPEASDALGTTGSENDSAELVFQNYVFKNTEVIEDENMSVNWGTITRDKYGYYNISVQIQNKSMEELVFSFSLYTVNREGTGETFYKIAEAGTIVTENIRIYSLDCDTEEPVREMVIGKVGYHSDSFDINVKNDDFQYYETTADYYIPEPTVTGNILYKNAETGVTFSTEGTTDWDCNFYFVNTSDRNYKIESVSAYLNGEEIYGCIENEMLLAHSRYSVTAVGWDFGDTAESPYNYTESFMLTDIDTGDNYMIENINVILTEDE